VRKRRLRAANLPKPKRCIFSLALSCRSGNQPHPTIEGILLTDSFAVAKGQPCDLSARAWRQAHSRDRRARYLGFSVNPTKQGVVTCAGLLMPMAKLDDIVIGEVSRRILELVGKGLMEATGASLRERLVSLRFRRYELASERTSLSQRLAATEPVATPLQVEPRAALLRDRLQNDSSKVRQSYAGLVLKEVIVTGGEIWNSGSKAILARSAADRSGDTSPAVLSFVRQWRTRQGCKSPAHSKGSQG
jgi:hypothetical protein